MTLLQQDRTIYLYPFSSVRNSPCEVGGANFTHMNFMEQTIFAPSVSLQWFWPMHAQNKLKQVRLLGWRTPRDENVWRRYERMRY